MGGDLLLSIGILIFKHGPEMTMKILRAWDVKNPTAEDYQKLRDAVPIDEEFIE